MDELKQENERLRERMARLSAASLRVSENLDLETVLRDVVDSARVLTGGDGGRWRTRARCHLQPRDSEGGGGAAAALIFVAGRRLQSHDMYSLPYNV